MNSADDQLLALREEFPILSTCTYLISNSLGAMPRGVYDKLREYANYLVDARRACMGYARVRQRDLVEPERRGRRPNRATDGCAEGQRSRA